MYKKRILNYLRTARVQKNILKSMMNKWNNEYDLLKYYTIWIPEMKYLHKTERKLYNTQLRKKYITVRYINTVEFLNLWDSKIYKGLYHT